MTAPVQRQVQFFTALFPHDAVLLSGLISLPALLKILDLGLPKTYFPHSSYMIALASFMDYWMQNQQTQPPVA